MKVAIVKEFSDKPLRVIEARSWSELQKLIPQEYFLGGYEILAAVS